MHLCSNMWKFNCVVSFLLFIRSMSFLLEGWEICYHIPNKTRNTNSFFCGLEVWHLAVWLPSTSGCAMKKKKKRIGERKLVFCFCFSGAGKIKAWPCGGCLLLWVVETKVSPESSFAVITSKWCLYECLGGCTKGYHMGDQSWDGQWWHDCYLQSSLSLHVEGYGEHFTCDQDLSSFISSGFCKLGVLFPERKKRAI